MIQYSLRCEDGHIFDSWFQSASAFDSLKKTGHVTCALCGSAQVEKAIMAPRVRASRNKAVDPAEQNKPMVAAPGSDMQKTLEDMKRKVEESSDYVGENFAKEARSMHLGEAPERSIYGQANAEDAKSLIEDGVPVLPLPFMPTRKTN